MSSKIDQHSSQTSRKYYQVDNLQDIFKLTKACKIMSKKNANLLAYVEDIEFTEFSIQHYMKSEMFSKQNLGEKKKEKKPKSTLVILFFQCIQKEITCGFVHPTVLGYLQ